MNSKPFSPEELEQLARLRAMRDEDIDLSDIPELTEDQLSRGFRPGLHRPIKLPVTIRLDADVVGWFKEHAGDKPYQTEINRVLRQYVAKSEKKRA
jgi:uncharacterized protein (DUF4415 family)